MSTLIRSGGHPSSHSHPHHKAGMNVQYNVHMSFHFSLRMQTLCLFGKHFRLYSTLRFNRWIFPRSFQSHSTQ